MAKRYLTHNQLRQRYGDVSAMWVERQLQNIPNFPRPIKIGRLRFWALDELEDFEKRAAITRKREHDRGRGVRRRCSLGA